jgi:protein involved in polysaccharide export with SLBB domain
MSGSANLRSLVLGLLAAVSLTGCAARNPQALPKLVKVERGVVWKVNEGDIISWRVYNDAGLSGTSVVGTDGQIYAIALGRVPVRGLTVDSLKSLLADRYDKITREAAVDVTLQRDMVVYGPNRTMGIVVSDPGMTVLALLARGGVQAGQSPIVSLIHPDGSRYLMPRDARLGSMDIGRADAVYVEDANFVTRNGNLFQGYAVLFGFIGGVLGLFLSFTR